MSEENKNQKMTVSIDTKRTEELARENQKLRDMMENGSNGSTEELKEENEDLKERLNLIAQVEIEKKLSKHPELSTEQKAEFSANPELLKSYEEGQANTGSPAGSAPLNNAQLGIQNHAQNSELRGRQFPDVQTMISTLKSIENGGGPQALEAKSYLDQLAKKYILEPLKNNQSTPIELDMNKVSMDTIEHSGLVNGLTPRKKSEGDLGRIVSAWQNQNPKVRDAKRRLQEKEGE